jgi:DDE family transposase
MDNARKETKLIRFVKRALNIIKKARIPFRSSKFSNKIYNNHIHLILHMLRVSSGMSYIRFFEWIENFTGLWKVLAISTIPHFTTLQKFKHRCPKRYLDAFIQISGLLDQNSNITTAIDSTGFSLTNASYHYTIVIRFREKGKRKRGRPRKLRPIKRYLKVTFVVDTDTQKVLVTSIRRGPDNDNKDFVRSYKKIQKDGLVDIDLVLADKGYDSESNHEYVHNVLGAESIIPARKNRSKDFKTRGKYRKEMKSGYDLDMYRQRNKVETVNSVIKRKMGDCVRARKVLNQNREILFMVMVYNIERSMKISLIILVGFLESRRTAVLK